MANPGNKGRYPQGRAKPSASRPVRYDKHRKDEEKQPTVTPPALPLETAQAWPASDSIPLSLTITFTGDWHVGSGMNRLEADRTIHRHPEDGLPWLPAKTVTGIWRDACEQVALGLDNGTPGGWSTWVEILFGDQPSLRKGNPDRKPVPARLSVREARLPQGLRSLLGQKQNMRLKEALTFLKPGVRIDPETGTALDDHLRTEEVARAGTVLTSEEIILDVTGWKEEQKKQAVALLLAGSRVVERLGGKRRRGLGRCQWELRESSNHGQLLSEEKLFQHLGKDTSLPAYVVPDGTEATSPNAVRQSPPEGWKSFDLALELLTPVVCTAATLGNVVESLDFIPGTHLLGAVARRLTRADVPPGSLTAAIARGDLRLLDARSEMADGSRGQPVPHTLFYDKEKGGLGKEGGTVWNRMAEPGPGPEHNVPSSENGGNSNKVQLKQHRKGYLSPFRTGNNQRPPFASVAMVPTTHNVVEDGSQRPTEAVGGVYTYTAISQGQTFRSRLLVRQEVANQWPNGWQARLDGEIRLGRAKKDDYGRVRLSVVECTPEATAGHEEQPKSLRLWLLSDCLIRDERLRPSTQPKDLARCVGEQLSRLAGKPPGTFQVEVSRTNDNLLSFLLRTRRREGWHQGWGLPRPSLIGLAAGSCVDFTVTGGELTKDLLNRLEQEGLGERRAEGFGEVACNHWLVMEKLFSLTASEQSVKDPCNQEQNQQDEVKLSESELEFARFLQKAAWRDSLARAAMALAHRDKQEPWQEKLPGNSQLGALRGVLAGLRSWNDRARFETWRNHLEATKNRRDKWEPETQQCLKKLTNDVHAVWNILEANASQYALPNLPEESTDTVKQELWGEAMRALWGAVSRREQRQREEKRDQPTAGGAS